MRKNFIKLFDFFLKFKKKPKTHHSSNLNPEKSKQIIKQLGDLMEQQRPFLNERYNIKSLADELKIQQYQLSAFLNRQMGMNFNDYLNQHRVRYCKELIQKGVAENLNLKGLANKCGFHNRNTFTTAFKKFTGYTPSDYTRYHHTHNISSN